MNLNQVIGQNSLKKRASIYISAHENTGMIPNVLIAGARGFGKTHFARCFAGELGKRQYMEVNAATIKSPDTFFENVFPKWRDNDAVLLIDECHELPSKLQEVLLSPLELKTDPIRHLNYTFKDGADFDFTFNFQKMSLIMATTDPQKITDPLRDRLTRLSMSAYNDSELFQIFLMNLQVDLSEDVAQDIIDVFRGHPRSCVELAMELDNFANAFGYSVITKKLFADFRSHMSIWDDGLNDTEIEIINCLGNTRELSLEALAAQTSLSRQAIQKDFEHTLLAKGLIEISPKRRLTSKGHSYFRKMQA